MHQLDSCPVCGQQLIDEHWIDEHQQFLVGCPQCTTFTITETLARLFRHPLSADDRRLLKSLSYYLHNAGDDDERELTETSWVRLAVGG